MWAVSHHLAKRLTRLSGLVPSGTFVAMWGSWVLLLPTMPLISAARVLRCRASSRGTRWDSIARVHGVWHDSVGGCHSSYAPSNVFLSQYGVYDGSTS